MRGAGRQCHQEGRTIRFRPNPPNEGPVRRAVYGLFDRLKHRDRFFWLLNAGYWSLYWLFVSMAHASAVGWRPRILLWCTVYAALGFLCGCGLRAVYRRVRLDWARPFPMLLTVTGAVLFFGNLWYGLDMALDRLFRQSGDPPAAFEWGSYLFYTFYYEILLVGLSILYFIMRFWGVLSAQREQRHQADVLARTSQIQMLRYQLNPHFLFNALNSARALVDENAEQARDTVTELSEFLRYSLITRHAEDIPLHHELEALRHYLAIEKKRYEDKLQVEFDIDPLAEEYPVIPFLVHPLVENAVKYGMRSSPMPLVLRVRARIADDRLRIDVCNTGAWQEPRAGDDAHGTGTGLENVRRRLGLLFPKNHRIRIDAGSGEVCVRLELRRTAKAPAAGVAA